METTNESEDTPRQVDGATGIHELAVTVHLALAMLPSVHPLLWEAACALRDVTAQAIGGKMDPVALSHPGTGHTAHAHTLAGGWRHDDPDPAQHPTVEVLSPSGPIAVLRYGTASFDNTAPVTGWLRWGLTRGRVFDHVPPWMVAEWGWRPARPA